MKAVGFYLFAVLFLLSKSSPAASIPDNLTYEGVLTDTSSNNPVDLSNAGPGTLINFYIVSGSGATCVLFGESITGFSTTGAISHTVGTGTVSLGTSANIPIYFSSAVTLTGVQYSDLVSTCNVAPTDLRILRVVVPSKSIVADVSLTSVPYALAAKAIDGYDSAHVLKLAAGASTTGSELTAPAWLELSNLIAGTSTQYVKQVPLFFRQLLNGMAPPVAPMT